MKNKKNSIIILSIVIVLVAIISIVYVYINKNKNNNTNITLQQTTLDNLNEFNQKLDQYYIDTWNENKFLSSYSYLVKNNGEEVTIQDIEEVLGYTVPEELKNVSLHFVKPKSLKPYLGDKIIDDDPEILTVYSALPVENGMYVSSTFDEGGFISEKDYKQFVTEHSWVHGEVRTPNKDDKEYIQILEAVQQKDNLLQDGNVKHIACDDKYAMIVISSKDDPAYLKQYALQKNENNGYDIIVEGLEGLDNKIFINYAYTDFELSLLPLYEIYNYENISSSLDYVVKNLKESGELDNNEELTYSCGAGNFIYLEFKSNLKMLLYINQEGLMDIYEVDNFKTALSQMLKLETNPPAFILNFE